MERTQLEQIDRQHVWHPFTQQQGWEDEPQLFIERAEGTTLYDTEGNTYIDGVSSLWCNVHGHRHPKIDAAIREQLDRVAHTTMLGLSHPVATELAQRLIEIAPEGLNRVFYSDNGSTTCEIALKMAFQYQQQRGETKRTKFIGMRDAYHGDTIGSVSVGGIDLFHATYRPLLFETISVEPGNAEDLERAFQENRDTIAAVIIEPLVQGAAGMLTHPDGYLRKVREICTEHDALLICDEVATGFGRTGTMFACEQEEVAPDLMCVAKGITGGYLPLAATFTTEEIYRGFLAEYDEFKTFFHGHTYTGNPLACAAALATLDVFEEEATLGQLSDKIELLTDLLASEIVPIENVHEIRQCGFMVGIELAGFDIKDRAGHQVTLAARKRGAIIRPLGDVVVLMPPLSISSDELERLVAITAESISEVCAAKQAARA